MLHCRGWQKPLLVVLALVSFGINFTATAVDPQPSATIPRPLTQYLLPLLVDGRFSPDVPITPPWSAQTFTGHTSVNRFTHDEPVVFFRHGPGSVAAEWASFNLGEPFFGAGDARSLIPIAVILAIGAAAILAKARQVERQSATAEALQRGATGCWTSAGHPAAGDQFRAARNAFRRRSPSSRRARSSPWNGAACSQAQPRRESESRATMQRPSD